ncbi:hypothetical protein VE01_05822 [Pseudogymnoascus verrucosus]|uniref:F-box domain-containing protein n=1 Tax=Pseudogymnoascus verrucosus TaxID=342668 RepID=A0A1B8GK93_9PEZI|nr:uncharacterized protein VE01_05822 [Pseudogymnoascus verrucosus]OBT96239.1 hypothetical protein VE01_05822 [Pseudogymnoascus verrucosus]
MASSNSETAEVPNHASPALRLPPEIVKIIVDQVPNSTIKSLRLTCRLFLETVDLRLDRVFISANPRNVEVFTAIANHEVFRAKITEIIWDDAILYVRPMPRSEVEALYGSDDEYQDYVDEDEGRDENGIDWRGDVPGWFRIGCRENIYHIKDDRECDLDRLSLVAMAQQVTEQMPMEKAWAYYQELLQQQRDVRDSQAHINALEKYVGSFPALKRITITAATHEGLYNPLYETPMIRSFPRGFNYYLPFGYPPADRCQPECDEWDEDGNDWQGFRTVMRVLTEGRDCYRVMDLRIDDNEMGTMGLNSRVFEKENRTLDNFEAVLALLNFTHLQLDLIVDEHYSQAEIFCNGLLRRALAGASGGQGLKHLSLSTDISMHMYEPGDDCDWYIPLAMIFTPTRYSRLQHFGLASFYVEQDDLLALLASLPKTLRSVELSRIEIMDIGGSYQTLLCAIRDKLGWKERVQRPTLAISSEFNYSRPERTLWLKDEIYSFLYQDGSNPFEDD